VLRRTLLAALLCVSAWATADRLVMPSSADMTTAASAGSLMAERPSDTDGSDRWWDAQHRLSVSTTESGWSSQRQYVEIAGVLRREGWSTIRRGDAPKQSTPFRPPHLHDTPLLI
jgi:hypothetical protein